MNSRELPSAARRSFFERNAYLLLSGLVAIPIFMAANSFVKAMDVHEDEAVATAITIFFIAGVFVGRYLAQLMSFHMKSVPKRLLGFLSILIVAMISWLFFHADFPLQHRPAINLLLFWMPLMIISLAAGMLVKFFRELTKKQLVQAQSAAAHSKSELHVLQSQLSPHFLFNTLNNLYGLSITQPDKLPALLLKLSELLRYTVYEAGETFVSLKDEMNYLRNYIQFEKIRMGDRLVLKEEIASVEDRTLIAPMVLIIFVENAFKHSRNNTDEQVYIEIKLQTWENWILFSIQNSHKREKQVSLEGTRNGGFGLVNVKKRLDLLYDSDYKLDIQESDDLYKVTLQLKAKKV